MNYYIYYRVQLDADAWRKRVNAMQAALEQQCGIRGQLLLSPQTPPTWMEVYERVQDERAFEATLARLVREFHLDEDLLPESRRMLERFAPL